MLTTMASGATIPSTAVSGCDQAAADQGEAVTVAVRNGTDRLRRQNGAVVPLGGRRCGVVPSLRSGRQCEVRAHFSISCGVQGFC